MDATYDFTRLRAETTRREQLLKQFQLFRTSFVAELRRFLSAAQVEYIYGVSDLEEKPNEHTYRFSFNGLDYAFFSGDSVLRTESRGEELGARIVFYYESTDPQQPPLLDITFKERAQDYGFLVRRNLTSGWQIIGEYDIKSDEAGKVAARIVAQQILETRAAWLDNMSLIALSSGNRGHSRAIGFRPSE